MKLIYSYAFFLLAGWPLSAQICDSEAALDSATFYVNRDLDISQLWLQKITEDPSCLDGKHQVEHLLTQGDWWVNSQESDSGVALYQKAYLLAGQLAYPEGQVLSNYKLGRVFIFTSRFAEAISRYRENLEIIDRVNSEEDWVSIYRLRSLGNLGVIYNDLGSYNKALEYFLEVIRMSEEAGNQRALAFTLNNIGSIYIRIYENDNALRYLVRSLQLKKELGLEPSLSETYLNIGSVYYQTNVLEPARIYFDSALQYAPEGNVQVDVILNIASTYEQMSELDSAEHYFIRGLELAREIDYVHSVSTAHGNLAGIYNMKGNYTKALSHVDQSLAIARDLGTRHHILEFMKYRADILANLNRKEEALVALNQYIAINDSIFNAQKAKEFNELTIVYETEQKEQEIANLNQENIIKDLQIRQGQNRLYLALGAGSILLLGALIVILLVNQRRLKSQRESEVFKQKLLRAQMNPHFIFNSLNAIQNYVINHQADEAAGYLAKFARLMRAILVSSAEETISLEQEIELIESYLELQQLRMKDTFDWQLRVDPEMDRTDIRLPPMLTQPFIENCVEHAFREIDYKGIIEVDIRMDNDQLLMTVKDNGVGIDESPLSGHKSMAIDITRERIARANKPIQLQIQNLIQRNEPGTLVELQFQL